MITLDKITVQVAPKIFTQKTKKYLRIQTFNSMVKTNNYAKVISQTGLQWQESIQLPLIYGNQMHFQIFQKHQFGYNPQQIQNILHGKIVFVKGNDKYNNWEIYDNNLKKIGFLSVNVKSKPSNLTSIQKNDINTSTFVPKKTEVQPKLLIISSIVVNISSLKAKRAYAQISVGEEVLKTSYSKSRSGQLVFVQKYELETKDQINEGIIDIYSCGTDQPQIKLATCIFQIDRRINRKLKFCDSEGNEIGQGFIDGKLQLKSQVLSDKLFASMIKQSFRKQKSTDVSSSTFKEPSKSILGNISFVKGKVGTSLDLSSSRSRISILNNNNNIKIPQQKRFFSTKDPVNNKCSYLHEHSFQFKQKYIDRYYKGASIGYGDKVDFSLKKKEVPSVGKYNLPSIWDRY